MNKTRCQGTRLRKYHIARAIWTDYVTYFIWQIKYSKNFETRKSILFRSTRDGVVWIIRKTKETSFYEYPRHRIYNAVYSSRLS